MQWNELREENEENRKLLEECPDIAIESISIYLTPREFDKIDALIKASEKLIRQSGGDPKFWYLDEALKEMGISC